MTSTATWDAVDAYFADLLLPSDSVLDSALAESAAAGLPEIAVAPNQGALLGFLVRLMGARKILEIGTLGGYSSIWFGRALPPGGRLITLEIEPERVELARRNIANAGLSEVVDVRLGRGLDLLPVIEQAGEGPFDLIFIDADKPSNPDYFEWALKLSHPGSLIIIDNVVRSGAVTNDRSLDANVKGVRTLAERMAREPRIDATVIQTVGVKGYDGLAFALVK